jgi:hypothetical protein
MSDHRGRATPPRPPRRRWRPWLAVLVGALALALGVAACSSGDKTSGVASLGDRATATTSAGSSGKAEQQRALAFTRCMRQHGINMPDPNPDIDWRQEGQAPGWDAAWQACRQLLSPSDLPQSSPPSAEELGQLRAFAVCMRAHDIDMSDPDPKTGNMTTGGRLGDLPRDQVLNAPGFKAAEAACRDKLPARELQQKR